MLSMGFGNLFEQRVSRGLIFALRRKVAAVEDRGDAVG